MTNKKQDVFAPDRIDWIWNNWHLVGIGLVVLGFAGFAGAKQIDRSNKKAEEHALAFAAAETAKTQEAEEQRKALLRSVFAVGPLPPKPKLGTPPTLPPIPPVNVRPDGKRDIKERIRYLVQQNPIDEIRGEMNELIDDGALLLNLEVDNGLIAAFTYVPIGMIRVQSGSIPQGTMALPAFSMSPAALEKIESPTDALRAMIVVYHEFQHYRQWESSTEEVRLYFLPKRVGSTNTASQCAHVWESELDAYAKECSQALAWGITDSASDLCLRSEDPVDFRRTLFVMLGRGPQGQHAPECLAPWAKLAGHPHPEAYE